jgi:hypothetical protein
MRSGRVAITRSSAHSFCVSVTGHAVLAHHVVGQVDLERAELAARASCGAAPALDRAQPREQLGRVVGLDEVVVGAGVQPADAVGDLVARGEHDDDGALGQGAHLRQQREAVAVAQVQVEQHRRVLHREQGAARVGQAGRHVDHEGLGQQVAAHGIRQGSVIFDQQYAHAMSFCKKTKSSAARQWPAGQIRFRSLQAGFIPRT